MLLRRARKPDPRALPVVSPSSSLALPEVIGKIKGSSFCPGHITSDITAPSLSESSKKADCSFALSAAAENNVINRGAR